MEITSLGHASFRIKGKQAIVVTDPYVSGDSGRKFPKHIAADIITVSRDDPSHNGTGSVEGAAYVVNAPGEYEIKNVGVIGRKSGNSLCMRIEIDGLSVVHLSSIDQPLSEEDVECLDGVDILFVPLNGPGTASCIHELEPSVVIPMMYTPESLTAFCKEMGKEDITPQSKYTVTRDKLPEQMQVVVLE